MGVGPTLDGFTDFINNIVQIPTDQIDPGSYVLDFSFNYAMDICLIYLDQVPSLGPSALAPTVYAIAVYNLGADTLINYAPDIPGASDPTYWSDLRASFGINEFTGGVINFSSDQSTSTGVAVADAIKQLTIMDLGTLNTPWGRNYMAIAQNYGTLWGMS
jgi:hypothetical protein